MLIKRGYKVELRPTQEQTAQLARHCGTARFAFNFALGHKIEHYKDTGKTLSWLAIDAEFNRRKKTDLAWVNEVSKWAHGQAIRDCEQAFRNFFRRLKNGEKPGFPRFKSKHRSTPKFRVAGERVKVEHDRIRLPKIGWVRLRRRGYFPLDEKINSVTISQRAGRWFASAQVEQTIDVPENQRPAVGIDLGLTSFAVSSDGTRLDPPKPMARSLRKLQRLSRQLSRKKKGSHNRQKAKAKLAKLHFRIANQRNDFLHKASHLFTSRFGLICVETLLVQNMQQNRRLARSISDAGWGEFARQVAYKSLWRGVTLVEADTFYPSTKTCSVCGVVRETVPLSVRQWKCECGAEHDRDLNAAKNLENYGRAVVAARTLPQGETPVETAVGQSPKQEAWTGQNETLD